MTKRQYLRNKNEFPLNSRSLLLLVGLALTIVALFPQTGAAQTTDGKNWVGTFTFFDMARASSAARRDNLYAITPGVEYNAAVTNTGSGLSATLEITGIQQFEVYECSVKVTGDKLNFYFLSNGVPDGGQRNLQHFKKDELLFSLVKIQTGKSTKFLFQPASYKIIRVRPSNRKQRIYFEKT